MKCRKVCVNKKRFEQGVGYGLWSLLTVGMITVLVISSMEINTVIYNEGDFPFGGKVCYLNYFDGRKCTSETYWEYSVNPTFRHFTSQFALIINTIFIGLWIYHKQEYFKLGWCVDKPIAKNGGT